MQPTVNRRGPWLMRGDRHGAVRHVQEALNARGAFPRLSVDGDFGPRTEDAVISFQKESSRVSNVTAGIVGELTLDALNVKRPAYDMMCRSPIPRGGLVAPKPVDHDPDWRASLGIAPINLGAEALDPYTGKMVPAPGNGYRVSGYQALKGGRVTNDKGVWEFHGPNDPDRSLQTLNECAKLPQAFGVPLCRFWRKGPRVCDLSPVQLLPGTVVATMRDGLYHSDYSGRSHVGIFDGFIFKEGKITGFYLFDQSNGNNIARTPKMFGEPYAWYEMQKRKHPKAEVPKIDTPVVGSDGKLHWETRKSKFYKNYQYNWVGHGEEYFVVYSDGRIAAETM